MYQPNQPMGVPPPPPASSNRSTIIIVVLVALLFIFLTAIIAGGLGYWIGSRPSAEQAETTKNVNTTAPIPAATAIPTATPTASPTPTPTPDVGGKYTGPTGDVEISNVTDKTFNFNIGVGNSNGSGQIDGQATRTSPTMAVYSKIPDPDLYNDPDSEYYHKKCHITFRFNGPKLAVSEDDFACNYWHGAAVDFNGTFTHKGK